MNHRVLHEAIWAPLAVLGFLIARFVEMGSLPKILCPFKTVIGIPCLTCGGTRAAWALARFDLPNAFLMNPLVAICGVLAGAYVVHSVGLFFGRKPWVWSGSLEGRTGLLLRLSVIGLILGNWGYLICVGR